MAQNLDGQNLSRYEGGNRNVSSSNGHLEELAEQALRARPKVTIRTRLVFGFLAVFLGAMIAISVSWFTVFQIEERLTFIERADKFANEIQQCRRYEKNYHLYRTSLNEVFEHLHSARKTLAGAKGELGRVVGKKQWDTLELHLEEYAKLIFKLQALRTNNDSKTTDSNLGEKHNAIEKELRLHGSKLVDIAILMSKRERTNVKNTLVRMRHYSLVALVLLLALSIYVAQSLYWHLIKRLNFLTEVTQRIGKGNFEPIMPVRKYKDEFTKMSIALNRMMYELESRNEQLIQAGKIAAVGTLTAGIAHEINNPVNNISLIVESLYERIETMDKADQARLLSEAMDQCDRVSEIVKNLLEFSRASHPRMENCSIIEIVNKVSRLVQNEMKLSNVEFSIVERDPLPMVKVDKSGIQQVLLNLFLNAIQAMPSGGKLSVIIQFASGKNAGRIDVTDNGIGISKEDLSRIFDPFFTSKNPGEGTGLGLSVSHGIIEKHGGWMEVKSTPGNGTTFSIFLPFDRPAF
jgi:signal transduction histidine kinase